MDTIEELSSFSVLTVNTEEFDEAHGAILYDEVETILGGTQVHIVIDIAAVEYMTGRGLEFLVRARKMAQGKGGAIHLSRVRDELRNYFHITNQEKLFLMYDSISEAISAFRVIQN